jgi:hypothetical protein
MNPVARKTHARQKQTARCRQQGVTNCPTSKAASSTKNEGRKKALILFAENLARCFYGFEPDFFQQNVSRIVDDVVSQIHASLEIWPTLIEICYFHKDKREFPQRRIDNKKVRARIGNGSRSS